MQCEDEIEFFNFVPSFFLNDLHEKLSEFINSLNNKKLSSAFEKNFYIFEIYALKNIFSFPEGFAIERKLTDKRLDVDLQKKVDSFIKTVEENHFLSSEKARLLDELEVGKFKTETLDDFLNSFSGIEEIVLEKNKLIDEKNKLEIKYKELTNNECRQNDSGIDLLLQNDCIKEEIYRKENEEFCKKIKFNELEDNLIIKKM
ncbi:hypothetical protein GVAV_001132 [Gurleya vavrai]